VFEARALVSLGLARSVSIEKAELAGLIAIMSTTLRGPVNVDLAVLIGRIVVARTKLGGVVYAYAPLLDCSVCVLGLRERCAKRSCPHCRYGDE
jgi:hypothetical protein